MNKPLKLHANLVDGLRRLVDEYRKGAHPERLLERHFRLNKRWGKRDRRWLKDTFYHYLRFRNRVDFLTRKCGGDDDSRIKTLIRSAHPAYESLLDFTPGEKECLDRAAREASGYPWLQYGVPKELWDYMQRHLAHPEEILQRLNEPSLPIVRVNTLKIAPEQMAAHWKEKGYGFRPLMFPETFVFEKPYRLTRTVAYRRGLFEVQDISSQAVVKFAGARPGQKVVDACAGAGGKTLHLAAEMQNRGELTALDIYEDKIRELRRRARRAGVRNLVWSGTVNDRVLKRLESSADLVLADAPCSNSGTYKRKPHRKWYFNSSFLEKTLAAQRHVLDTYARLVRPGGHLVYATCSVLPGENQKQIKAFLERNKDFIFVDEQVWLPGSEYGDGFYMAKLRRK